LEDKIKYFALKLQQGVIMWTGDRQLKIRSRSRLFSTFAAFRRR